MNFAVVLKEFSNFRRIAPEIAEKSPFQQKYFKNTVDDIPNTNSDWCCMLRCRDSIAYFV